jgi:hypothetical protein
LYAWVKNRLQEAGLVSMGKARGTPRRRRERAALAGTAWDLIVTMDDATSEVYSGFFVEEEANGSPVPRQHHCGLLRVSVADWASLA